MERRVPRFEGAGSNTKGLDPGSQASQLCWPSLHHRFLVEGRKGEGRGGGAVGRGSLVLLPSVGVPWKSGGCLLWQQYPLKAKQNLEFMAHALGSLIRCFQLIEQPPEAHGSVSLTPCLCLVESFIY